MTVGRCPSSPKTQNPKPLNLNPKPQIPTPKPKTLILKPQPLNPKPKQVADEAKEWEITTLLGIGALERYSIEFLVRKGGGGDEMRDETRDATQILLLRRVCAAHFFFDLGNSALVLRPLRT